LAVAVTMTSVPAMAQQIRIPTVASQVPGPVVGTAMTKDYVQMVGRAAYFWGYPLVATTSRRDAFAKAPERIYEGGVVLSVAKTRSVNRTAFEAGWGRELPTETGPRPCCQTRE
jgi:hypothetical protein